IAAEYFFKEIAKISATHVPFQGGAPAIAATIGNQIDLLATTLGGGAAAQIASGKLKGLGVASAKRAALHRTCRPTRKPATQISKPPPGSACSRRPIPARRSSLC